MAYTNRLIILFLFIPGCIFAQSGRYNIDLAPDLWYNKVDGIRLGMNIMGEQEGTFLDGAHRLNAGIWLGTNFPDLPVSYYVSFTEPIPWISDFGSEGNVQLVSSVRTGFSRHGLYLNKRWQTGFNEMEYLEFSVGFSTEKMFDLKYRQFPYEWSEPVEIRRGFGVGVDNSWKNLLTSEILFHNQHLLGPYSINLKFWQQIEGEDPFNRFDVIGQQKIDLGLGFQFRLRGFFGLTNKEAPYQYSYISSMSSMIEWLDHGISRAKGTIPTSIFDQGIIHFAGGANLRGYLKQDIERMGTLTRTIPNADRYLPRSIISTNIELDFPNPLHKKLTAIPFLGDFLEMRSYFFYDIGTFSSSRYTELPIYYPSGKKYDEVRSDFGTGFQFSINIPDYLGKDRGLFIRYEIPFWLSDPDNEPKFKWRNLIGMGAVISL